MEAPSLRLDVVAEELFARGISYEALDPIDIVRAINTIAKRDGIPQSDGAGTEERIEAEAEKIPSIVFEMFRGALATVEYQSRIDASKN